MILTIQVTMRLLAATVLLTGTLAQSSAYGQCGGSSWLGATTCVSGYVCSYANDFYSQCVPGTASSVSTTKTSSTLVISTTSTTSKSATSTVTGSSTVAASATSTSTGKFKWLGINESGGEFGSASYPGIWGTDFIFPANSSLLVRLLPTAEYS